MFRLLSPAALVLLILSPVRAEEEQLAGIWKNTLQDSGVSFWELTPKKGGGYVAQEVGLGSRHGTALFKDGVLFVEFLAEDHKGVYEWRLIGPAGEGSYTQTSTNGESFKRRTSIRFIGK